MTPSGVEVIWPVAMPSDGREVPSGGEHVGVAGRRPEVVQLVEQAADLDAVVTSTSSSESPRSSLNAHSRIGSPCSSVGAVVVPPLVLLRRRCGLAMLCRIGCSCSFVSGARPSSHNLGRQASPYMSIDYSDHDAEDVENRRPAPTKW